MSASTSAAVDHTDPAQPPPPRLLADATDEQRAERAATMKERAKRQRALSEKTRDRSGRQQESGAQHRKKADTKAEKADKQRRRSVINYHRKAARSKGPTPLFVAGLARRREEEELLGARFVMEDQGVRITGGRHAGRCGVVVHRALLCEDDERGCQVVRRPKLDAAGGLVITEPYQKHTVLFDKELTGKPDECVEVSPLDIEQWPRAGQLVLTEEGEAAVVKYMDLWPPNPEDMRGTYQVEQRLQFAYGDITVAPRESYGQVASGPSSAEADALLLRAEPQRIGKVWVEEFETEYRGETGIVGGETDDGGWNLFHLTGACPRCLAEARDGSRQLSDVCVEVKHTTYLSIAAFDPVDKDATYSDLEPEQHYTCGHM